MIQRALDRAYRRLGPRYLQVAVVAQLQLVYPVILLSLGVLALYVDMSVGEYLRVALVGVAGFVLYNLAYGAVARRRLEPVRRWLEGRREQTATIEAWTVCASFPYQMMRREWVALLGAIGYSGLALWALYVTWELGFPAYTGVLLFVGIAVFALYVQALRFFALEQVLRPVLTDIAGKATDEVDLRAQGPALRVRLLAALPAINVITGVFVAGVFQAGDSDLADLGLAVLISAAVASTSSLALTLLLVDSITAPLSDLREATSRVGGGDFAVRVPVVTTDETGELARSFNGMAAGLEERERIREAFGTYVDREVAEHILREGTDLGGEQVEVTMMFVDVRDFTRFAERASAQEVVAAINRLFEHVVPIIHEHGGHVDKFVGDGLLAVFGAPRRQEDHADEALEAALGIERAVRGGSAGELEIGIGLNSGTVVAGNVGGAGRLEFSVIGDAVNVAARVEAATRKTGDVVLLADNVRRLLRDHAVQLDERPGVQLKGKSDAVTVYAPNRTHEND